MLDLSHPKTPDIFGAARQLDLILEYLKRMTVADRPGRLFMLEVIRPAFAALRWLNAERFGDSTAIAASLANLEAEAEALVHLHLRQVRRWDTEPPEVCPACTEKLTTVPISWASPSRWARSERHCSGCLARAQLALDRVSSLEDGFGTMAI